MSYNSEDYMYSHATNLVTRDKVWTANWIYGIHETCNYNEL
jgi:hypothetical protein